MTWIALAGMIVGPILFIVGFVIAFKKNQRDSINGIIFGLVVTAFGFILTGLGIAAGMAGGIDYLLTRFGY